MSKNCFKTACEHLEKFKKAKPYETSMYDKPVSKLMGEKVMDLILLKYSFILDEDNSETIFLKARNKIFPKILSKYGVT